MKILELYETEEAITKKYNLTNVSGSVGFSEKEQKWYGWSHRGLCGFKIGDMIFDETFEADDKAKFIERGDKPVKTLDDAKKAAENFRDYVS